MISIRLANVDDYIPVAKLHASNWQENYRGIYSDFFLDHEVEENRIDVWYGRFHQPSASQVIFIAEEDDELAGFACLFIDEDPAHGSLIDNLHVSSGQRQQGVGRMLMNKCSREVFLRAEVKKMYLWVYEDNRKAIAFYEKMNGALVETVEKENEDGSRALVRRYCWSV